MEFEKFINIMIMKIHEVSFPVSIQVLQTRIDKDYYYRNESKIDAFLENNGICELVWSAGKHYKLLQKWRQIITEFGSYSDYLKIEEMTQSPINDLSFKILKYLYKKEHNKTHPLNELFKKEADGKSFMEIRVFLVALMNKKYINRNSSFTEINGTQNLNNHEIRAMILSEGVRFVEEAKANSMIKKTDKEVILSFLALITGIDQYSFQELFIEIGVSDRLRQDFLCKKMLEKNLIVKSNKNDYLVFITDVGRLLDSDSYDELFILKENLSARITNNTINNYQSNKGIQAFDSEIEHITPNNANASQEKNVASLAKFMLLISDNKLISIVLGAIILFLLKALMKHYYPLFPCFDC